MMSAGPSTKEILGSLTDKSIDAIRLDWDAFKKDLRHITSDTSPALLSSKEWAAFLMKRELGYNQDHGAKAVQKTQKDEVDQPPRRERPDLKTLRTQIGQVIYGMNSTGGKRPGLWTPAEDIRAACDDWIKSGREAPSTDFSELIPEDLLDSVCEANCTTTSDPVKSLTSLARVLTRDKGSTFSLKKEHFHLLRHADSTVSISPDLTGRAKLANDITALNESLQKHRRRFDSVYENDVTAAWYLVHVVLNALVDAETEQQKALSERLIKLNNAFEATQAVQLRSFEEYWTAKTEKWRKKGNKKANTSNGTEDAALEELDMVFETYLKSMQTAADAHWDTVLQPSLQSVQAAIETFVKECKSVIDAPDVASHAPDFETTQMLLNGLHGEFRKQADIFSAENKKARASLACTLDDLRSAYLESSSASPTVLGRLERCGNRECKKRIRDLETEQHRQRVAAGAQLDTVASTRPLRVVCLNITLPCLSVGEIREREATARFLSDLAADPTLKSLCSARKRLDTTYRSSLTAGQVELGKALARVLLAEGARTIMGYGLAEATIKSSRDFIAAAKISIDTGSKSNDPSENGDVLADAPSKKKKKKKSKAKKDDVESPTVKDDVESPATDITPAPGVAADTNSKEPRPPSTASEAKAEPDSIPQQTQQTPLPGPSPSLVSLAIEKSSSSTSEATPMQAPGPPGLQVQQQEPQQPVQVGAVAGAPGFPAPPAPLSGGGAPGLFSPFTNLQQHQYFPPSSPGIMSPSPPGIISTGGFPAPAFQPYDELAALRTENTLLKGENARLRATLQAALAREQETQAMFAAQRNTNSYQRPPTNTNTDTNIKSNDHGPIGSNGLQRNSSSSSIKHRQAPANDNVRRIGNRHIKCLNCSGPHASAECNQPCRNCLQQDHGFGQCPN
ncbi:hypothetical protein DFJ77DRAFT_480864 [Powellomyces hirtus]|nr:hypothetical protein DFJ77DRAFT_480864 [Powellomyces hirtus]